MKKFRPSLKTAFIVSLIINLAFFGLFSYVVYRKGGIKYLGAKLGLWSYSTFEEHLNSTWYQMRLSIYDKLPQHDKAIVFAGDSITDFGEWQELLQIPNAQNRSIAGDGIEAIHRRVGRVLQAQPGQLFLMVGINDLMGINPVPDDLLIRYKSLIELIKEKSPQTQIIIQSILPVNDDLFFIRSSLNQEIRQVNNELSKLIDGKQVFFVDLHSQFLDQNNQLSKAFTFDGLHLNGDGFLKWKEIISPYLISTKKDE